MPKLANRRYSCTHMFCIRLWPIHTVLFIIRGWVNLRVRRIALEKGTVSYLTPRKLPNINEKCFQHIW